MTGANKGSSSPLVRWDSFSCPITAYNNLLFVLIVYQFVSFGAGVERTRSDLRELIRNSRTFSSTCVLNSIYSLFFLPFCICLNILLVILLILNEISRITEQTIAICCYVATLGISNFSDMAALYGTFMNFAELVVGPLWHDSKIILQAERMKCELCPLQCCKPGACYDLDQSHPLFDTLNISCECFKIHVQRRMDLSREHDGCKLLFEQTDRITEGKLLLRPTNVLRFFKDGCGHFDDDVMERQYDMGLSMWMSVRLQTVVTPKLQNGATQTSNSKSKPNRDLKFVTFSFERTNLDESVQVPIDERGIRRLVEMPQLRYSFLRPRARKEGSGDVIFTHLVVLRRLAALSTAALAVRFASKTFREEIVISWMLIALAAVGAIVGAMRERVCLDDVGGADGSVARMFAIDSMSRGKNLIRYSNSRTSWSRHIGFGGRYIGPITLLENILFNRAIVMGNKMISLSREGTAMYISDIQRTPHDPAEDKSDFNVHHTHGSSSRRTLRASGWRKVTHKEVIESSMHPMPDIDLMIE